MKYVQLDTSNAKDFFDFLKRSGNGDLRKEFELFLEAAGMDFLRMVEEEIQERKIIDTTLLLRSFQKGDSNNVWVFSDGGLTLEVGSVLEYARPVNDGHWTNPKGVYIRFVPGYFEGNKFVYDRSAKGGMILKQKWIDGKPYWDHALKVFQGLFPDMVENKIDEWLNSYL